MQSVTEYHGQPAWITLVVILAGAFVLGLLMRSQLRGPGNGSPIRQTMAIWISLAIGLGLFLLGAIGFTATGMVQTNSLQTGSAPPSPNRMVAESTVTIAERSDAQPAQHSETAVPEFRMSVDTQESLGILVLLALLGGIAFFWNKIACSTATTAAPSRRPTNGKSGFGWLIVPVLCLAVLGTLAAPKLVPDLTTANWTQPAISVSQQERMDKVVLDLIEGSSSTSTDAQSIPDWIKQKSSDQNLRLLSSGQYSTRQEAEDELLPIAADLLQRAFHKHHPWQGAWNVPLAQVRDHVVSQQFVERRNVTSGDKTFEMFRLHILVNTAPEVCETFTAAWKSQIVEQRLKVLGLLLAWLSCVFLLGSAYYRSLALPGLAHQWAGTIKVSVLTIGVTALAAWVLVTYIH